MKKRISLLLATCIIVVSGISASLSAYALETEIKLQEAEKRISVPLKEALLESTDISLPVTVEFNYQFNEDDIAAKVYNDTGISKDDAAAYSNQVIGSGTSKLSDEEKEQLREMKELKDIYTAARRKYVREFFLSKAEEFIKQNNITTTDDTFILGYAPFITNVEVTASQVNSLSFNEDIYKIYYDEPESETECVLGNFEYVYSLVNQGNQYKIIRGNMAVEEGYTGNGIRVGMIDAFHPDKTYYGSNVVHTNSNIAKTHDHPSAVADIIFAMAPECTIYSYAVGEFETNDVAEAKSFFNSIVKKIQYLVDTYNVDVVNMSYGSSKLNYSTYEETVRMLDKIVINSSTVICIAAGNSASQSSTNMNIFGYAPNVITVGAVSTNGTDCSASDAYTFTNYSLYKQEIKCISKPDICAPEYGFYLGYSAKGTSFATPYVTGTVIQMMSRNPWMPQQSLKAAVLASGTFKPQGFKSDIDGTIFSTKSGAGVIDAYFCLKVAGNGRRTEHTFTSTGTWKTNVYADYATKPFRIAITWNVAYDSDYKQINPEINMRLTKNGKVVASSTANSNVITGSAVPELDYSGPCTNYEVIELSPDTLKQYGAGTYELTIYHVGSYKGPVTVGAAWEQW